MRFEGVVFIVNNSHFQQRDCDPEFLAAVRVNLAHTLMQTGDGTAYNRKALRLYANALSSRRGADPNVYMCTAHAHLRDNDIEQAVDLMRKGHDLNKDSTVCLGFRSRNYEY